MKKTSHLLLTGLVAALVLICSCKKDSKKSNSQFLTQKNWIQLKSEERINNGVYVDDFPNWDACDKDDIFKFLSNNTYSFEEGASKCNAADPQVIGTGIWTFAQNETQLSIGVTVFNIDQLDDNTLVLSTMQSFGGDTYYYRDTYGH
ncbi:MAG: hypothetical protein GC171_07545 [Terrimonas sp.]|nr:hypothetical protein [Terrimonas sp.]